MEILLRKASGLEKAATQTAAKIELDTTLKLSPHSLRADTNFNTLLNQASLELATRIQMVLDLHEAASAIRAVISVANTRKSPSHDKSVNDLLSEQRGLDAAEKILMGIQTSSKSSRVSRRYSSEETITLDHDAEAVKNAHQSILVRAVTMTSGSLPVIELPSLSPGAIQQYERQMATIKRRRMDLKDELAYANLQKITLPEKVVTILRNHDII